jgi:hypothetical protein
MDQSLFVIARAKRRGDPSGVLRGLPQSASLLRNDKPGVHLQDRSDVAIRAAAGGTAM